MKLLACVNSLFALLAPAAYANTEKVVFLAPASQTIPNTLASFDRLASNTLTPTNSSVRASLPAVFPIKQSKGLEHWYLLRSLNPGQRYEVRICWAAIQPTDFYLEVFTIDEILQNRDLLQGIAERSPHQPETSQVTTANILPESILGLRIQAAATFFTTNQTSMLSPPPVDADIILDPYLANIFPTSLLPIAIYILGLTVIGCFVQIEDDFRQSGSHIQLPHLSDVMEPSTPADDHTQTNGVEQPATQTQTPQHPFYTLPAELILDIVDLLPPEAFINFAFANYPLLHTHGLAPALSRPRISYIMTQTQIPTLFPLLRIPAEIMLHIMRNLKPIDIMRFVVANYQDLARQGIAPPLTAETVKQLLRAIRAKDGKVLPM